MTEAFNTPWSLQSNAENTTDYSIPFATRSQSVSRNEPELPESPPPPPPALGPLPRENPQATDLLDRIQPTSHHWMEVYEEASPRLLSGQVARRLGSVAGTVPPGPLPPPSELYGRKRGKAKARLPYERRVMAVVYHLEELKRKQSNIDQAKTLKWGCGGPQSGLEMTAERPDVEGGAERDPRPDVVEPVTVTVMDPPLMISGPRESYINEGLPFLGDEQQFLQSRWSPSAGLSWTPATHSVATAERHKEPLKFLGEEMARQLGDRRLWGGFYPAEE